MFSKAFMIFSILAGSCFVVNAEQPAGTSTNWTNHNTPVTSKIGNPRVERQRVVDWIYGSFMLKSKSTEHPTWNPGGLRDGNALSNRKTEPFEKADHQNYPINTGTARPYDSRALASIRAVTNTHGHYPWLKTEGDQYHVGDRGYKAVYKVAISDAFYGYTISTRADGKNPKMPPTSVNVRPIKDQPHESVAQRLQADSLNLRSETRIQTWRNGSNHVLPIASNQYERPDQPNGYQLIGRPATA